MSYCVGLSTSHFAWAFHSVAEEELLSMLPAVQKGDPTWSELRAMGIGWWVRNIHSLRKCIEKVSIVFQNKIAGFFLKQLSSGVYLLFMWFYIFTYVQCFRMFHPAVCFLCR